MLQKQVSWQKLWKKFYERFCHSDIKVRQAVALLSWGHILRLLQKVGNDDAAMLFYAQETRSKGWNRDLLLNAIKLNMYETQALARVDNNFDRTLPAEQAQYANEVAMNVLSVLAAYSFYEKKPSINIDYCIEHVDGLLTVIQ